jgi:hypothetical protein
VREVWVTGTWDWVCRPCAGLVAPELLLEIELGELEELENVEGLDA